MDISRRTLEAGVHLVKIDGPLNSSLAGKIKQTFRDTHKQGARHLIVDLKDVPFMDSSGLAALVAGLKIFNSNARNFCLVAPQTQPKLLFELTGFDSVFQVFDNVAEALNPGAV